MISTKEPSTLVADLLTACCACVLFLIFTALILFVVVDCNAAHAELFGVRVKQQLPLCMLLATTN